MRIHCLQHVHFEGPAAIGEWAERKGHGVTRTPLFEHTDLPAQSDFDWLVVMGGPMGIHDEAEHPWLVPEKAFVAESIAAGKTVVGVCLGSQLIAHALGARVYRNPHTEIGWMPIMLTDAGQASPITGFMPPTLEVFHWHGDTFELPPGATHLARSAACEHQIYLYEDRVLGLQCHLESTPESIADIVHLCADEIRPSATVQGAERMLAATEDDYARIHGTLFALLDRLAATGR
ncbi:type 1 glutamine amidotransferase [Thiocystis violacea]|uniref:type 1 glutamine amidotransferase n=1 Tax=Thiocystis violacea TaxID=13725 RepID=UPI001905BB1C|nr:type 1 glutamine amidotransferase [Thiocystis violacea]MBK1722556.1 amidotransferase [Thiocystis violacea]